MDAPERYVTTSDAKRAVDYQEEGLLFLFGIQWQHGKSHIDCPYPTHGGKNDWRWDSKFKKAYCTCSPKGDGIIDVIAKVRGIGFEAAKVLACETIGGCDDLIKTRAGQRVQTRQRGQRTDATALMNPPAATTDASLPRAYLAHRLGIDPVDVLMPTTAAVGWQALDYWDPPAKQGGKLVNVGQFPCAVFGTVAADGSTHTHRIYVAAGGAGKAELGTGANGNPRDAKKSAKTAEGDTSTAGRSVLWGDPKTAPHVIVAEGIETAAAVAHVFRREIEAGEVAVAAAISANGVQAWQPYPATHRVTMAADRDEEIKPPRVSPTKAGEKAAREFGLRRQDAGSAIEVRIALPGAPGTKTDWLDALRADGIETVRGGIEAAAPFVPTEDDLQRRADRSAAESDLERIAALYPVPEMNGRSLFYKQSRLGEVWLHKKVQKGKGDNAEMIDVAVASPFGITARLRMIDAEDSYGLRLVVEDMGSNRRNIDIERGDLASMGGVEVKKLFLRAGVRFEDDGEVVAVQALKAARPENQIAIVRHPGWHSLGDDRVFVAPGGEVVGLPEGEKLELSANVLLSAAIAKGGSLDGWKEAVAAAMTAPGCPHFTLGISAGFAGVLVDLCGLDSCGINLSGQTSAGKTTAQRLAASVWSVPDSTKPGMFQVAKTTVNGFEALAARANGTVFALDELAHLTGKETAKVVYTLASGIGKARMTAGATMRDPHRWKTFAILSSETSLEAKIRADGETWTGGQAVRIPDVDVSDINRLLDAATFTKISGVAKHYGHAGPAFVRALVATGTHERATEVRDGINEVARRLAGRDADAATIRAALPFAILATAGLMAQEHGLLPKGGVVFAAVCWAWAKFTKSNDALALNPAEQAIRSIQQWVGERWDTSIHGIDSGLRSYRDAVGWWDNDAVYLTPDALVEAAGGALKESLIAKSLSAAGMLAKTKDAEHLSVSFVPKVGRFKAYALSRSDFGRGSTEEKASEEAEAEAADTLFPARAGGQR